MAMIAVQVVLEQLASFVAEETRFLGGVRGGIDELRDDLYSMKSFLQDAEERSERDEGLRAWVKQVRDVAYDAEDILEEFMLRFAPSHGSGFVHFLRNSYSSTRKLSARHRLAAHLQSIKARVKAISERRNAFSLNRIDMPSTSSAAVEKWHDPRIASLYLDEADVVGIRTQNIYWFPGLYKEKKSSPRTNPFRIICERTPELVELIHLRYLSLRWTMIRELPESIRNLKYLEILDLKRSNVSSLTSGITQLTCLCQLRNYGHSFQSSLFFPDTLGMRVPSGIGRLTSLQKLGSVEVNEDYDSVRELGKLTQLRRLGILKLREEQGMDLCYTLERLKHLTAMYLVSLNKTDFLQLDSISSPPKYLQRLYLKCSLSSLLGLIASLQYISKLVLQYSNLKSDPLKALQKLPSLVVLELRQAYAGEELWCDPGGFSKLKKLGLHELERLQRIRIAKGSMPGLERLDITACTVLETVPDGIENLKNIEDLVLWEMPSSFIKTVERRRGEDFWRVQHITTITRIYKSRGCECVYSV
ncbi:hypothetical protein OIU76_003173 [Salix suchowensis]|nr:hypothetical protein OIU76_003173 [Salix suchowensis]